MTDQHHTTKLDRDCERIVRPMTDDFLAGYSDGYRGWSARKRTTRFYRRGYWKGWISRDNRWMATFGEGAAD